MLTGPQALVTWLHSDFFTHHHKPCVPLSSNYGWLPAYIDHVEVLSATRGMAEATETHRGESRHITFGYFRGFISAGAVVHRRFRFHDHRPVHVRRHPSSHCGPLRLRVLLHSSYVRDGHDPSHVVPGSKAPSHHAYS